MKKYHSVDDYLLDVDEILLPIIVKIRHIILAASPLIKEEIKYQCPFYSYNGMLLYLVAKKDKIIVGFCQGVLMKDAEKLFVWHKQTQVRHLIYYQVKNIKPHILNNYILEALAVNDFKKMTKKLQH